MWLNGKAHALHAWDLDLLLGIIKKVVGWTSVGHVGDKRFYYSWYSNVNLITNTYLKINAKPENTFNYSCKSH